jgi:histone deacetylase 6
MTSELNNGFAAIRPPGHHAEPSVAAGYCLVNHVAVAARYAQFLSSRLSAGETTLQHPVRRVLIVDWDVHHGNGTQSIFENDPSVLYFSVHRWHSGQYYPFQSKGGPRTVGLCKCPATGDDVTRHVNVGWTQKGMGDEEYLAVWRLLLLPMAREFRPDLVLVSAGFDAADGDMGDCHVTHGCFAALTKQLRRLAGGRVVCSLEGGYVRRVLSRCVTSVVEALVEKSGIGEDEDDRECDPELILSSIDHVAGNNIRSTIEAHRNYWRCLSHDL